MFLGLLLCFLLYKKLCIKKCQPDQLVLSTQSDHVAFNASSLRLSVSTTKQRKLLKLQSSVWQPQIWKKNKKAKRRARPVWSWLTQDEMKKARWDRGRKKHRIRHIGWRRKNRSIRQRLLRQEHRENRGKWAAEDCTPPPTKPYLYLSEERRIFLWSWSLYLSVQAPRVPGRRPRSLPEAAGCTLPRKSRVEAVKTFTDTSGKIQSWFPRSIPFIPPSTTLWFPWLKEEITRVWIYYCFERCSGILFCWKIMWKLIAF